MKRWQKFTVLALIVVGSCSILLYRIHYKVATSGGLAGFTIGMSADEVIEGLISREEYISIRPIVSELSIGKDNFEYLYELSNSDAILVRGNGFQLEIVFIENRVKWKKRVGQPGALEGEWRTKQDFFEDLESCITNILGCYASRVPPPIDISGRAVVTISNTRKPTADEISWLKRFNHWYFRKENTFIFIDLHFDGNFLSKIEATNYFTELP